jgi:hypothetical protein
MRHHTSGQAKALWLIMSGAMLGGAMYMVIGGVGIVLLGVGIGIKLPGFILVGIGLILVNWLQVLDTAERSQVDQHIR